MSTRDDQRSVDRVLRRRASPELSAAFAGAVRELFQGFGWWTDLPIDGDFECVPPVYDDVRAAFHANGGCFVDLRVGKTSERYVDIAHLVSRLLVLASLGCGRLPDSPIEIRRLVSRAINRSECLPTDDASLDSSLAIPAFARAVDEMMSILLEN
jgi:hypothetical protein